MNKQYWEVNENFIIADLLTAMFAVDQEETIDVEVEVIETKINQTKQVECEEYTF